MYFSIFGNNETHVDHRTINILSGVSNLDLVTDIHCTKNGRLGFFDFYD